jgi:hypothetical protein
MRQMSSCRFDPRHTWQIMVRFRRVGPVADIQEGRTSMTCALGIMSDILDSLENRASMVGS